ncbi:MAG: NAD-dependent epimerase/dehydratase family protein [Alphaproteobacteria bacterium]|jgi:UDP-glucose 4-epimerase|nr:NAD-dependent epimerase/dehydratase family protein [Alphaproteobacteria bacterium]|tara:strand:+ start:1170 stop:2171 length:1002 start_codon:yes stop_codon:yes gene_type:complete
MRIFISGIAGFLGSHLADRMIFLGHHVFGCDNLIGGYLDNVPKKAKFYQADCNDFNLMKNITKNMDIVIHCAATAYEGLSVFSPNIVTKNIVGSSVSLITASICNKVKRIVYCSSMARYGSNKVPFTEDMKTKPQDPYGIGKVAGEEFLKNLCDVHKIEWVIAVPHNIIGPRQKYDDPYRNVASIMINLMLQKRNPIIYGDGKQKRCFSFIKDDIDILTELAFSKKARSEIINIGPDDEFVTINELSNTISNLLAFNTKPIFKKGRPQEVFLANCSADKARKMFNYKTKYSLKQGLQEMITYIKNRGVRPFKYHLDLEIINEITPETWKNKLF